MFKCSFASKKNALIPLKIPLGAPVAQLVECPTSAQIMILWFVSLSPASGSVLTTQSLEPALDSVCLSLFLPSSAHALSLSQK